MPIAKPQKLNQCWGMDFISDRLDNGQQFRILAIIDLFSRECLMLKAGISLTGTDVVKSLEEIRKNRSGKPVENAFVESFNGRLRQELS